MSKDERGKRGEIEGESADVLHGYQLGGIGGERHEAATGLKRSITVPIPSGMGSVFLQMMETNVVPVLMAGMLSPRTLLVRFPRHADNMLLLLDPLLHPPQFLQHAFRTAFDHIAVAAKLKITNHISALHKAAFLNYARHRKLT
ncbi:hypothetical protein VP01_44g8 [Puccinia sorghi]|uniref:Uncharacterized protein n=1 Tax=Puccinia sorghi TaxID=27349 RepID=A0A0L6UR48_9BASI|nr:hypothetical protein VP01_44g8 [Puccinia sorghi]